MGVGVTKRQSSPPNVASEEYLAGCTATDRRLRGSVRVGADEWGTNTELVALIGGD